MHKKVGRGGEETERGGRRGIEKEREGRERDLLSLHIQQAMSELWPGQLFFICVGGADARD